MRSTLVIVVALTVALCAALGATSVVAFAAAGASARPLAGASNAADRDRAREALVEGRFVSLESILADARERYPGRILEIELDDDEYEVEILTDGGHKVELEYDARTGRLVDVDYDD